MPITLRKRQHVSGATSTPRVPKKRLRKPTEDIEVSPIPSPTTDADESNAFEDARALPAPDEAQLAQQHPQQYLAIGAPTGFPVDNEQLALIAEQQFAFPDAQGWLPDFEQQAQAPQLRPPNTEHQPSVDAAQQPLTHASQAPGCAQLEPEGRIPAIAHGSQQDDAMSNTNNAAQQNGANTVDNAIVGDDGNAAARCRLPPICRAQPRICFTRWKR